ncbi:MAG: SDR family oxidoreductase [Acidobacteria bacterium]|nr:SDR family oxidoreductase [Acidobacteriota bacterium]
MIIVTGASGEIGRKIFEHHYLKDPSTIGTYHTKKPDRFDDKNLFKLDISDYNSVESFISDIRSELKNICLINGAAITYDAFAHKSDPYEWAKTIDINLKGSFNIIRGLLPVMRQQQYGRIINLSSVVAQKGFFGTSAYAASKSGLWGMTKSIAIENAEKNILINSINLGYMDAGMTHRIPSEIRDKIRESIPLKKFGPISDILLAIEFLINSSYVTGTNIDINGGLF